MIINYLTNGAYDICRANKEKGFYENENALLAAYEDAEIGTEMFTACKKAFTGQRLALIHSEISEALEADRKD